MELEVDLIFVCTLLKLLTSVLLVADNCLQPAFGKVERVVPYSLVVPDLLEGQGFGVGLYVVCRTLQLACRLVALSLNDARSLVVDGSCEVGVAPWLVQAEHQTACTLLELGAWHVAVVLVLIGMGHFVRETGIPYESLPMACEVEGVVEESVVRLIFRADGSLHLSFGQYGCSVKDEHTGHGIAAVHQRGRPFQNLHRVHVLTVDLDAVFVAPLLAFLPYAFIHDDDAVISKAADDGLGDATARGNLCNTRLLGDGVDDVRGGGLPQFLARDNGDRSRRVLQLCISCDACHYQLIKLQVTEEYVGGVHRMDMSMVLMVFLCCRSYAYT